MRRFWENAEFILNMECGVSSFPAVPSQECLSSRRQLHRQQQRSWRGRNGSAGERPWALPSWGSSRQVFVTMPGARPITQRRSPTSQIFQKGLWWEMSAPDSIKKGSLKVLLKTIYIFFEPGSLHVYWLFCNLLYRLG